jgi:hypothetical protein
LGRCGNACIVGAPAKAGKSKTSVRPRWDAQVFAGRILTFPSSLPLLKRRDLLEQLVRHVAVLLLQHQQGKDRIQLRRPRIAAVVRLGLHEDCPTEIQLRHRDSHKGAPSFGITCILGLLRLFRGRDAIDHL